MAVEKSIATVPGSHRAIGIVFEGQRLAAIIQSKRMTIQDSTSRTRVGNAQSECAIGLRQGREGGVELHTCFGTDKYLAR